MLDKKIFTKYVYLCFGGKDWQVYKFLKSECVKNDSKVIDCLQTRSNADEPFDAVHSTAEKKNTHVIL